MKKIQYLIFMMTLLVGFKLQAGWPFDPSAKEQAANNKELEEQMTAMECNELPKDMLKHRREKCQALKNAQDEKDPSKKQDKLKKAQDPNKFKFTCLPNGPGMASCKSIEEGMGGRASMKYRAIQAGGCSCPGVLDESE